MFKPIKYRRISEEIVDQIKLTIIEGRLKPGDKLPSERELSKQLSVSRVPLREALNSLKNMGFVEIKKGSGSYVRSMVTDRMFHPIDQVIKDNKDKILELIEVREEIESWSAYHAASRATEEDIERLGRIVEEMKENFDSQKMSYKLDVDFHLAISQASHNTIQSHLMFAIYDLLSEYLRFFIGRTFSYQDIRQRRYDQHCRIFEAIKERNAEKAQKMMLEHFESLNRELKKMMEEENLTSMAERKAPNHSCSLAKNLIF